MVHSRGNLIGHILVCAWGLYAGCVGANTPEDNKIVPIVVDLHELSQRLKSLDERLILENRVPSLKSAVLEERAA